MQDFFVFFNVILYIFTFLFYLKKRKKLTVVSYVIAIYAVSGIFGIIFYYSGLRNYNNIELFPFVYFYIIFLFTLLPIITIENKIRNSNDKIIANYDFLKILGYFILVVSIIPFIESCILLIKSSGMDSTFLVEAHDQRQMDREYERVHSFSSIGSFFLRFCGYFRDLAPVLLFYFLARENRNKWIIIGLLMSILTVNIMAYLNSGRSVLVNTFIYFIFLYFLFRKYLDTGIEKKIKKYGIPILSSILVLIIIITIVRFNYYFGGRGFSDTNVLEWISLYAGEGMLNFNEYVWGMNTTMDGDYCFSYYKELLGMDTFTETFDRRTYWEPLTGIPQHIFYTYIGNIVEDLGKMGGIAFFMIVALSMYSVIKKANYIYLHNIFLIFIWAKLLLGGYAYYCYSGMDGKVLLIDLILYVMLRLTYRLKKKELTIH